MMPPTAAMIRRAMVLQGVKMLGEIDYDEDLDWVLEDLSDSE